MKKVLAHALLLALAFLSKPASAATSRGDALIGAWRLVSLEEPGPDGKLHKADCTGLLVFTRDGHMSVQVMYRDPQPQAATAPVQYAQGGYEASFGRYEVDERARRAMIPMRKLGRQGLEVSAIGLGCMGMSWSYGTPMDKHEAITLM